MAAPKIFSWFVRIGGKTLEGRIKIYGSGCTLDHAHVLGALHCWDMLRKEGRPPLLVRKDGLFLGQVVFENRSMDIVVYKCLELVEASVAEKINEYPAFSNTRLGFGQSVGYTAKLTLRGDGIKPSTSSHFAIGTVSMLTLGKDRDGHVYGLTGCIAQAGFSGAGVFRPDASLAGIVVENIGFRIEESVYAPIISLPAISPTLPVTDEINGVLALGAATTNARNSTTFSCE